MSLSANSSLAIHRHPQQDRVHRLPSRSLGACNCWNPPPMCARSKRHSPCFPTMIRREDCADARFRPVRQPTHLHGILARAEHAEQVRRRSRASHDQGHDVRLMNAKVGTTDGLMAVIFILFSHSFRFSHFTLRTSFTLPSSESGSCTRGVLLYFPTRSPLVLFLIPLFPFIL